MPFCLTAATVLLLLFYLGTRKAQPWVDALDAALKRYPIMHWGLRFAIHAHAEQAANALGFTPWDAAPRGAGRGGGVGLMKLVELAWCCLRSTTCGRRSVYCSGDGARRRERPQGCH